MDTRADPLGLCTHRSSFIDDHIRVDQSRPSTFEKNNGVDNSEKNFDFGQIILCSASHAEGNVLHIARSNFGGSTSTVWPNADRSLTALISSEFFKLPKRSRSCNGRIEKSATVTEVHSQRSSTLRTRGANLSRSNDLRETYIDGHSSDSKSHKIPGLPHHGPSDSKSTTEDDYKSSQETRDIKTHMKHAQFAQLGEDKTEPTQVLLGLTTTMRPMNEVCVSTAFSRISLKRSSIEKEDEEIPFAARFKKLKQRTRASPSNFYASKWLSVDWNTSIFILEEHLLSSCTGVNTSKYTDRSDRPANITPSLRESTASSPNSLGRSENLNDPNISASPFVSVLNEFNKVISSCDAMERFQSEPTWCLANRKKDGSRCQCRMASKNQQAIRKLLTKLAAMNMGNKTSTSVAELVKLIKMAVCHNQRDELEEKVSLLIQPDSPKDSARPSAGPIVKEAAIKGKLEKLPSSLQMRDESRTTEGQEVQPVDAPIAFLGCKIIWWWREPRKTAFVYLPAYHPYRKDGSHCSNVEEWVKQQAETPLTKSELTAGYLYVYWNRATFGVRKIGFSTRDVSVRLGEWERDCKHIAEEQYRSPSKVRNVKRVERLVHAELKDFRVEEHDCPGCKRDHDEWFKDVNLEIILESIEFWTDWVMKEQYEEVDSEWLLKEDAKNESSELCTRLSVANIRERKEKSIKRTSQRHNLRPNAATRSSSHRESRTLAEKSQRLSQSFSHGTL